MGVLSILALTFFHFLLVYLLALLSELQEVIMGGVIALSHRDPRIAELLQGAFPNQPVLVDFLDERLREIGASPKAVEFLALRLQSSVAEESRVRVHARDIERFDRLDGLSRARLTRSMRSCLGDDYTFDMAMLGATLKSQCVRNCDTPEEGFQKQNAGVSEEQIVSIQRLFRDCYAMLIGFDFDPRVEPVRATG